MDTIVAANEATPATTVVAYVNFWPVPPSAVMVATTRDGHVQTRQRGPLRVARTSCLSGSVHLEIW